MEKAVSGKVGDGLRYQKTPPIFTFGAERILNVKAKLVSRRF